jgi:hypothetical protein
MTLQLLRHVNVFLAVDDLFGHADEETLGFPALGSFPRTGLKGSFSPAGHASWAMVRL